MNATVVELDLIDYTELVFRVEKELGLGAEGVSRLNSQLRGLVSTAIREQNLDPETG